MRKILFRGKRLDNGEWVFGCFCEFANQRTGEQEFFIQTVKRDGRIDLIHKIDPATIGQYTGLQDKHGNRIFEWDIVESEFTKKAYIVCFGKYTYIDDWGDEQEACGWYNIEEGGYKTAFANPDAWATIIGNIHDNPELLGG